MGSDRGEAGLETRLVGGVADGRHGRGVVARPGLRYLHSGRVLFSWGHTCDFSF